MNAEEYLKRVEDADKKIEEKQAELGNLWTLATSTTQAISGMPHATGVSDKVGNVSPKIAKAREETNEAIDSYIDIRAEVIRHVEMLPTKQCAVLKWLYCIKRENRKHNQPWGYTWRETAEKLGCTEQNIGNVRKKALRNLQKILDFEEKQQKVD